MPSPYLNRAILQALAEKRLSEAKLLLDNGHYDGAYYLAGYAVECVLKACIAMKTRQDDFPSRERANQSYKHRASELLGAAELAVEFKEAMQRDPQLAIYWTIVDAWSEESRYQQWTGRDASELYQAITDLQHGIIEWIKQRW
jgi:uncharacterized protein (UPF0332 family)